MNWKRGLLRLWLLVSIVWITGGISIWIGDFAHYGSLFTVYDGNQAIAFPNNTPKPVVQKALLGYLKKKADAPTFDPGKPYTIVAVDGPPKPYILPLIDDRVGKFVAPQSQQPAQALNQCDSVHPWECDPIVKAVTHDQEADSLLNGYYPKNLTDLIAPLLFFVVLPPIALMALGSSIYWVVMGFGRKIVQHS
jgi:hypothetical protein